MGIKGIWDLLKPTGQPTNLETLRGKVLAIDISFWLHHAKFISELKGISEHRAAVELIYRRILKLLHFGIRPIFVFDGPESSILKLPTLRERKKQREHQADEKAKRSQNRAVKNLARKALAVQLAREEGQRQKKSEMPSTSKDDNDMNGNADDDDAAIREALSQETVQLSSDDDEGDNDEELTNGFAARLPSILSQRGDDGERQQKSVSVLFSGADHAHVLIRSGPDAAAGGDKDQRGFFDDTDRRREAVERVRRLAALEHLKNHRQNHQMRRELLASRLLVFEDEKRLESSDDEEFEEVPDMAAFHTVHETSKPSSSKHRGRKRPSESPTPVADLDDVDPESNSYTVERWGTRRQENGEQNGKSSGGEIAERCRELLTYFGVPFVDSPAEAEAQCVYLESCGLTNGTITDDSDVWALGGRVVYRHIFDRKKSALEYRADNVMETFGLEQLHFVALAVLLGCDFTPGVLNVGIVSALEIVSTFVTDRSGSGALDEKQLIEKLAEFRHWWEAYHVEEGKAEAPEKNATKRRLRKLNCIFPSSFPDRRLIEIFTKPKVKELLIDDPKKAPFVWSQPDMENLRRLLSEELPDTRQVDVELADLRRRLAPPDPSQVKITTFYQNARQRPTSSEVFEASSSKRLKKACKKLKNRMK